MKPDLFVHIGYPRTATTLFQEKIFPQIKDVRFIGKTIEAYPEWLIGLHYYDDFEFEHRFQFIKSSLDELISESQPTLLSSEAFTRPGDIIYSQARRLHRIAPQARIIISLRDPIELLYSFHKYLYKTYGYFMSLNDSVDFGRTPLVMFRRKAFYLPDFYYSEALDLYSSLFGQENILVLRHEVLESRPKEYFGSLLAFLGVDGDTGSLESLTREPVNDSRIKITTPELRLQNLQAMITEKMGGLKLSNTPEFLAELDSQEKQYEEMRPVLIEHLKGRCAGYY